MHDRELKLSETFRDFPRLSDLKKFMISMKYFMEKMKYFMETMKYFIEKMKCCGSDEYFMDKMMNKSKVPTRTTTIFKLVGPCDCEIPSHGQQVQFQF